MEAIPRVMSTIAFMYFGPKKIHIVAIMHKAIKIDKKMSYFFWSALRYRLWAKRVICTPIKNIAKRIATIYTNGLCI